MKSHKTIRILNQRELENGWQFAVAVNGNTFSVTLDKDYYQKLTNGTQTPQKLLDASFEFLLSKEQLDEILSEFNLSLIQNYFNDYEDYINGDQIEKTAGYY
jgi:hypothetical protein